MGMRINTNVEAFNAQRNLAATSSAYAKSVEKLSSGLRINRAGDDAAGLSISEKLRAQTKGLAQAQRNAQDGISLIQTAEGALNETHSILQRMRELTVQAANDTLADSDRNAIKSEMGQLSSEIDRIAQSTQFNGKNLLDGSLTATKAVSLTTAATGLGSMADTVADVRAAASFSTSAVAADYKFTITDTGRSFTEAGAVMSVATQNATSTGTTGGAAGTNGTITVNGVAFTVTAADSLATFAAQVHGASVSTGVDAAVVSGHIVFTSVTAGAAGTQPTITGTGTLLTDYGIGSTQTTYQTGINQNQSTGSGTIVLQTSNGTATVTVSRGESLSTLAASINAAATGITATVSGGALHLTNNALGVNGTITVVAGSSTGQALTDFGLTAGSITATAGSDVQGTYQLNGETATHAMSWTATAATLAGANVTLDLTKMGNVLGTGAATQNNSFTVGYHDSQANLQIGANAQQTLAVGIEKMDSTALGVNGLDVSSGTVINGNDGLGDGKNADGSLGTLAKIDQAIASVSNQRSNLGAYQNRLEHTISNLGVAQENLTASESRIRDVDMAAEMVNFTKTGILQQAGQSILAQANQAPQGVLSLLRG